MCCPPAVLFAAAAFALVALAAAQGTKGTTLRGFKFSSDVSGARCWRAVLARCCSGTRLPAMPHAPCQRRHAQFTYNILRNRLALNIS
jgi:hypothetical protein